MLRASIVIGLCGILLSGCSESPQQKYDAAVRQLEQAQEQLDRLRPGYDAARQTAANAVCREIAGTTPEESASAAFKGFGDVLNDKQPQIDAAATTANAKKGEEG